jgi:imidazolonepropionase-like amidohydrolase
VGALLLRGATVIEAPDVPERVEDVLVVDGIVAAVGPALVAPEGAEVVELGGRYVVAGLLDLHVHLMNVPGSTWLPADSLPDLRRRQLASYVACGVAAVLDVGILPERLVELRATLAEGAVAPVVRVVGGIVGPAGGYPSRFEPGFGGVATRADVAALLDANVAAGAVGTKVTFERGFSKKDDWPLLDAGLRAAVREESAARGLPIFVHAMTPQEYLPALDLQPAAFVHGPERPDRAVTAAVAASGAAVVSTLTLFDAPTMPRTRALDDPLLRAVVPAELVAAAEDRTTTRAARRALGEMSVPAAPGWAAELGFGARSVAKGRLRKATRAARRLHEAGVPLLLGTDSGTWPLLHAQFPGFAAVRELELLQRAGLSPAEALAAGTSEPARLLGLDDLGSVAVGKRAELAVLASDPLQDPRAWRTLELVVHDGRARTPAEWARGAVP